MVLLTARFDRHALATLSKNVKRILAVLAESSSKFPPLPFFKHGHARVLQTLLALQWCHPQVLTSGWDCAA